MGKHPYITHLPSKEIDRQKWDRCIANAPNGLIYAYSYYLDAMADNWDAIVLNDYEMVMPLPWRKKYSISYIYQPYFVAQLGLFGSQANPFWLKWFLYNIPKKFRFWDFSLNHQNVFSIDDYPLQLRANYVLDLSRTYDEIAFSYRENIKRNIKKAQSYGCKPVQDLDINEVIQLAIQQEVNQKIDGDSYRRFQQLYTQLDQQGKAKTYGITGSDGKLLSSAAFFFSHNRAYYILVGNHPNGRTLGASHLLIDSFIRDHAGQNLRLDFEGSDLRNLAFFYSSFGASEEPYASIRLNRLPFYLKWMKK